MEKALDRSRTTDSGAHLRVLLVEDNEDHAVLVRRELEQRGHTVSVAPRVEQALADFGTTEYDVVATDYQLPDATGLQLLERIRGHAGAPPVVMMTASGSEQVAVSALKNGAHDYVVKGPGYERVLARALETAREKARAEAAETALRCELERRAATDFLTGLLNRGEMERVLHREMRRSHRHRRPLSFALLDVDSFKSINDSRGHQVGDAVLRRVAEVLRSAARGSDVIARWGGDEFALLLVETDDAGTRAFAARMYRLLGQPWDPEGDEAPLSFTASAGFVTVLRGRPTMVGLLADADRQLYAAKADGRGRAAFCILDPSEEGAASGSVPAAPIAAAVGAPAAKGEPR